MTIPPIPVPVPLSASPEEFDARADAFVAALPAVVEGMNAQNIENNEINENVNTKSAEATTAAATASAAATATANTAAGVVASAVAGAASASAASAASAATSANNAALSSGAVLWVSGTTYTLGQRVISPANRYVYRCIVAGAGTTDPSADAVNWRADALEIDVGLPASRPSFLADFAAVDLLDPRFGFTRGSTGTFIDANGVHRTAAAGVPRFDHDPATGAPLGLLIEPIATNLLLHNNNFTQSNWVKDGAVVTPNAAIGPEGEMTASKIVVTNRMFWFDNNFANLGVRSSRIYAKAEAGSTLSISNSGVATGLVNLTTGAITSASAGSFEAIPLPNGWWDVSFKYGPIFNSLNSTYIAMLATPGIYIAEAQLEYGAVSTSRIRTTTAQATRAADSATISGANFTSWFRQDEGTLFIDVIPRAFSASGIALSDGTANNVMRLAAISTAQQAQITAGGVSQAVMDAGTPVVGQTVRLALAYSAAGFALSMNGGAPVLATGTVPTVNQLQMLGHMTVRRATFYPKRLTNGQLQALTA